MEVKRFGLGLDRIDKWWKYRRRESEFRIQHSEFPQDPRRSRQRHAPQGRGREAKPGPSPKTNSAANSPFPRQGRLYYIRYAFKLGWTIDQIHQLTNIDPWFLAQMKQLIDFEKELLSEAQTGRGTSVTKYSNPEEPER